MLVFELHCFSIYAHQNFLTFSGYLLHTVCPAQLNLCNHYILTGSLTLRRINNAYYIGLLLTLIPCHFIEIFEILPDISIDFS
jgi:hypothetical protein